MLKPQDYKLSPKTDPILSDIQAQKNATTLLSVDCAFVYIFCVVGKILLCYFMLYFSFIQHY